MSTSFERGQLLGRYELLLPLARGGMAEVWAARLHGTRGFQKLVAIKTMLPGVIEDARAEQMFMDEAGLACQIQHPNVVDTIELGEDDGALFLVMEWIAGEPLNAVIKRAASRGPMPLSVAVNLTGQCCKGLQAAHELKGPDGSLLGVVHRDVSPHNILVSYTGTAKIVDFGIAKVTSQAASLTEAGEVKGKLAYMSPEHIGGKPVDRRSDIFSLGIVLYQLSTGKHPFRGASTGETIKNTIECQPTPPSKLVEGFPAELERVIQRALRRNPEERYATARDLLLDLRTAIPASLDHGADAETARYITGLFGERMQQKKQAIRSAMATSQFHAAGATSSMSMTNQSGTMGAVTSEDPGSYEHLSQLLKQNNAASRRNAFLGGGTAVVVALAIGLAVNISGGDTDANGAVTAAAGVDLGSPPVPVVLPNLDEQKDEASGASAAPSADPEQASVNGSEPDDLSAEDTDLKAGIDGSKPSGEASEIAVKEARPKRVKRRWRHKATRQLPKHSKVEPSPIQKDVTATASAEATKAPPSASASAPNIDDRSNFGGRW